MAVSFFIFVTVLLFNFLAGLYLGLHDFIRKQNFLTKHFAIQATSLA